MIKTEYGTRRVEIGDKIRSCGLTCEVRKIYSQDDWGGEDGIYLEFEDELGRYHYWKEGFDGGEVISK